MEYAKYFEDIQRRFDEASEHLVHYDPPSNTSIRTTPANRQGLPQSGEWLSLRQPIHNLIDQLEADPKTDLLLALQEAKMDNDDLRRTAGKYIEI